ncbi:hypothetical protein CH63R_06056 [Colletotrichum higginsianum IMI 349063]|uniref:Uncharacterized protein n=1 Tax=Colletotrichum higginsianum (strain IMI 349063) TaxID=759273 RepID=A0A1B7YEN6_COLHI|nr:hypothetical protein CH63R_06056 [Colletotrichum higginsianum IMI 349063]OBR10364.1 hypothetical protein CH63R_06056 [Colletotrichum higginsianum IMI 349063]
MDYEQLGRTNSGTECPFEGSVGLPDSSVFSASMLPNLTLDAGLSWATEIPCIVSGIHNDAPTAQQPNLPPGPLRRMAEGHIDNGKFDLEVQILPQCIRLYAHSRNDRSVHGFRDGHYPMYQMARGRTFEKREARHATRACPVNIFDSGPVVARSLASMQPDTVNQPSSNAESCGQRQLPLLQSLFLVRAKAFGPLRRARRNLKTHGFVPSARNSRRQVKQESIVSDVNERTHYHGTESAETELQLLPMPTPTYPNGLPKEWKGRHTADVEGSGPPGQAPQQLQMGGAPW